MRAARHGAGIGIAIAWASPAPKGLARQRPMFGCKATVLIADDEPLVRDLLSRILARDGYNVLTAADGQEAIQLASEHGDAIDLLVSDIQMPGMTGIELAKQLIRFLPNLSVLLMSGFSQSAIVLEAGWTFLEKPFLPKAILD